MNRVWAQLRNIEPGKAHNRYFTLHAYARRLALTPVTVWQLYGYRMRAQNREVIPQQLSPKRYGVTVVKCRC